MPNLNFLKAKAEQNPEKNLHFTVNAFTQNIIHSPAKPPQKRQKLTITLGEIHACRFTDTDTALIHPAGYRNRVTSDRLLWSITFKKLVRITAALKPKNDAPEETSGVLSDLIASALDEDNTLSDSISWIDVANFEIRKLTDELQQQGIALNTHTILLSYLLDYPILYAGWLASTDDKLKAARDSIHFCSPCPVCHQDSPITTILEQKLRGNYYPRGAACNLRLLNENSLTAHMERPALNTRSTANLDDNFIHLHALLLKIFLQIKANHKQLADAIDKDFASIFPDDTEFNDEVLVIKDTRTPTQKTGDGKLPGNNIQDAAANGGDAVMDESTNGTNNDKTKPNN